MPINVSDLPRFVYRVSVDDGYNGKKEVPLVCYGKPSEGSFIRDNGVYNVAKLYDVNGNLIGENVKVESYKPDK